MIKGVLKNGYCGRIIAAISVLFSIGMPAAPAIHFLSAKAGLTGYGVYFLRGAGASSLS